MVPARLSKVQQQTLDALRDGATVRQIAEERGVSLNSVYEIIHRLEERGLILKQYRPNFIIK